MRQCSFLFAKIVKGECNGKRKEEFLFILRIAEPPPVLFKDSERRVQWQEKRRISFHIAGCRGGLWHI